jgi:hypothetical protein
MIPSLLLAALVGLMPPASVKATDAPNDQGQSINVTWAAAEGESAKVTGYKVLRSTSPDSGFAEVGLQPSANLEYTDNDVTDGTKYWYAVETKTEVDSARSAVVGPVVSRAQWFNTARTNILILTVVICALFMYYLQRARKGAKMYIRKIAGLDAIDDALGRATEMGKPILFSFGLGYITDMVVIAALPLLRKIAKKSAEYSTRLIVPNSDPIVMTAAQETVKEAYTEMGRPDFYNADNVTFLTSDQFGYAAGVDGIILREKPGAIFWFGYFYAESLIMAETGHSVGAIQLRDDPASILRCRLRLHDDRRGDLRGVLLPATRADNARHAQGRRLHPFLAHRARHRNRAAGHGRGRSVQASAGIEHDIRNRGEMGHAGVLEEK